MSDFRRSSRNIDDTDIAVRMMDLLTTNPTTEGDPFFSSPDTLLPGDRIAGRYTIEAHIGSGGMGSVYRAHHDLSERRVALKVMQLESRSDPTLTDQFLGEIRLLGSLEHAGIARLLDADRHTDDGDETMVFFTMDYVDGLPADRYAEGIGRNPAAILRLMIAICEAVQYAHERHVIHCDLKPANILVKKDGSPVIVDFGLAKLKERRLTAGPGDRDGQSDSIAGTPPYMSPEQMSGGLTVQRARQGIDVYALGVVAFELLTGRFPYDFPPNVGIHDAARIVALREPLRLSLALPGCEPDLERVIGRAIRRDPANRYFSVGSFQRALESILPSDDGTPADTWTPEPGKTVPATQWVLDEKLGEGAVGSVWTCTHQTLKNRRIVKFCEDENKASLLRRELTLYRLLKEKIGLNGHFVALEEVSLEEKPYFLMSRYMEALDLGKWCAAHGGAAAIPEAARLEIVAQAAEALQAAHDAGVLHRDIKPSNLLVTGDPQNPVSIHVWVSDFGIGAVISDEYLGELSRGFTKTVMTPSSSYSGTHLYLAPELLQGDGASVRSDIFSLGVVLFQFLAGDFHRAVTIDWQRAVQDPLLRGDLEKCFAGNPTDRFESAGQLATQLRTLPDRRSAEIRAAAARAALEKAAYRRGVARTALAAAAIIAVVGGLAWYAWQLYRESEVTASRLRLNQMRSLRLSVKPGKREEILRLAKEGEGRTPADHRQEFQQETMAALCLPVLPFESEPSAKRLLPTVSAISSSGEWLAELRDEDAIDLRPLPFSGVTRTIPDVGQGTTRLWISDRASLLMAEQAGNRLKLWDLSLPHPSPVELTGQAAVNAVALHDSGAIAILQASGEIQFRTKSDGWQRATAAGNVRPSLPADLQFRTSSLPPATSPDPLTDAASTIFFNPDGTLLAAFGPRSLCATVWSASKGCLVAFAEGSSPPTAAAFNPRSRTPELAVGSENGDVHMWRIPSTSTAIRMIHVREVHAPRAGEDRPVVWLGFDREGDRLAFHHGTGTVTFRSAPDWLNTEIRTWDPRRSIIGFAPEGAFLAEAENTLLLWQHSRRNWFTERRVDDGSIMALSIDPQNMLVAAASRRGVSLLDFREICVRHFAERPLIQTACFSPQSGNLQIGSSAPTETWRRKASTDAGTVFFEKPSRTTSETGVSCFRYAQRDENRFAAIGSGRRIIFFPKVPRTGPNDPAPFPLDPELENPDIVALSPSGDWLFVAQSGTRNAVGFHTTSTSPRTRLSISVPASLHDAAWGDADRLWLRTSDGISILQADSWSTIQDFPLPVGSRRDVLVTDGKGMAATSIGSDVQLLVWERDGPLARIARIETTPPRPITCLAFATDRGSMLFGGTTDGFIRKWTTHDLIDQAQNIATFHDEPKDSATPAVRAVMTEVPHP